MRSIRTTITAITIVVILTSILSVFGASYRIIQSQTDENSVGMMNLIDQDTQKSLEKYFESIEQSVEVASNIAMEDIDSVFLAECGVLRADPAGQTPEQQAALDGYLEGYCQKIQQYLAGVADYTHGISSYYYCINPELSGTVQGFFYKRLGKTGFIRQEPLDVLSLPADESLGATWYETAVRRGCPAWVGPYRCSDIWVCSYFVPIYKSGFLIGVMGMDIPCEILVAQVNSIRLYETGFVCLLDENGHVIYHPDLPIGSDLAQLGLSIHTQVLQKNNSGDTLMRYTLNGEERQMSFSTLSNGMKLVSIAPAAEINAPWIGLIRTIALISVAVIAFFVVVILLLMRAITYPLEQLTDASQRLANADYDVDLTYQGKNEIGTLTSSFKRMRDQLKRYIEDLNHQIYYDRLTNLPGTWKFFSLAEEERKRLLAEGQAPVLVYFDMIGLGEYNRQYGFERGDKLIVALAEILEGQFGAHRTCRFGGNHFATVTDEARVEEELRQVLDRCETAMDGKRMALRVGIYPNRLEEVPVSVACDRAKSAADLHKGELSTSITWYDRAMLEKTEISRHIIKNLDQALEEGWVRVYYQPIIRASDGKVCDEEALARWIDPELGFLSPAYFIPALEESKLIYKLDLYVLEQVLTKMKQQTAAGFYLVPQSINLSRMDFERCDVVEEIRRRVDSAGIDRALITIEITESVIGSDFEFMKEQIARFRSLGFPVWMDDFGSGYSSLDVLQQIHFDLIKFDMRFMERFGEGNESKIILTELVNMAINLGTDTICEGVEQAGQVEFLREIGCTRIQGYYYGRPLPFEGIISLFEKGTTLEYENPEESDYFTSIGRINLYDFSSLSSDADDALDQYFYTLPMCIMEVRGTRLWLNRCNRSYRDFLERTLGIPYDTGEIDSTDETSRLGPLFLKAVARCGRDGNRIIIDEKVRPDTVVHTLIRRIAVNPVTGTAAVAVAVLAISRDAEGQAGARTEGPADDKPRYLVQEVSKTAELKDTIVSLMNHMPCMTFTKHAETGVYLACNQAFAEYAHKDSPEGVIGLTDEQIFDPETAAHFAEDDKRALSMDEPFVFCEDVPDAAGNPRQFQTTKLKYYNFDSQLCILGMCQDVTEATRIQRENAAARAAYQQARSSSIIFSHIAKALARGITDLYYVNMDTDELIEYHTDDASGVLAEARRGMDFFEGCRRDAKRYIHPQDQAAFVEAMDPAFLKKALEQSRVYELIYRRIKDGRPFYVHMRVSRVEEDPQHIVLAVSDIDELMRKRQAEERMLEERAVYARLHALTGNFLCVYVVEPDTGCYREFSATDHYAHSFSQAREGTDFFSALRDAAAVYAHPEDCSRILSLLTRENIMAEVKRSGIFTLGYRIMMEGRPLHVQIKAAMVEEREGPRLIVGLNDIDVQVRQEEEMEKRLAQAQSEANIDALTGVKNRHAYLMRENLMDRQIRERRQAPFAMVIFDVNGLKKVNDTAGHQAGDQYLRDACHIICTIFKRSPVFRVGGDEFAVIAQGSDYANLEERLGQVRDHNTAALQSGGIVIACGMARFEGDACVASVFERADHAMYHNKSQLKSGG